MKGLLYKDLHLAGKTLFTGTLIVIVASLFAVIFTLGLTVGNFRSDDDKLKEMFIKGFTLLIAGLGITLTHMCSNVMAMDEQSGWYKVLDASPVPAWKEILSRYILLIIVNTFFTLLNAIIHPVIFISGKCGYGREQIVMLAYIWLTGFVLICLSLPSEIVFPYKLAAAIRITVLFIIMLGLMIWLSSVEYLDVIIAEIGAFIKLMYRFRALLIPGLGIFSYMTVYLCRRKCGWRRI